MPKDPSNHVPAVTPDTKLEVHNMLQPEYGALGHLLHSLLKQIGKKVANWFKSVF